MIVAGIGGRRGVSAVEVVAAVDVALKEHGLQRGALTKLATTAFKKDEAGIFEAGKMMGLEVVVVETTAEEFLSSPPSGGEVSRASARDGAGVVASRYATVGIPSLRSAARTTSPPLCGREERSPSADRAAPPLTCLPASSPRERGEESQSPTLSFAVAGVSSVSEAAALAAAGEGARLAGPRVALGRVTCAIAFGDGA